MKNEKNIDELIKKALTEYVDADTKEETAEVTYSKEHEEKMKKIFDDMTKDTKIKKANREIVIRIKFDLAAKIAVAVVALIVVTLTLSTGIKAWKENNKLEMFGENEEYSWLLSENTSELYEQKTSQEDEEYVKAIFEGISGEISEIKVSNFSKFQRIKFLYEERIITLNIRNDMSYSVDIKNVNTEIIELAFGKIYCYNKENEKSYWWKTEDFSCELYGDLSRKDMIFIIENINCEKIETNF